MRSRRSARPASAASSRLDPRLRLAVALVVAGVALAWLGTALLPVAPGEAGVVARRGPAEARYDAGNDTTVAALYCGHWRCSPAFVLQGDQREALAARRVYLKADADDWEKVPIAPLGSDGFSEPAREAYAGPFEVATPSPRLAPLVVGPVLFAAGVGFALRRQGPLAPAWTTLGGAAGTAAGVFGASLGEGAILVMLLAFVVGMAGVILLLFRRTRMAGASVALAACIALWLTVEAARWFPSAPAV